MSAAVLFSSAAWAAEQTIGVTPSTMLCSSGQCEVGTTIGAQISGVTDFAALSDANIRTIRSALVDHKVIFFSGVGHMFTPETQLAFSERFGSVYPDISRVPEYVSKGVHQSVHSVRHDARTGMDHKNTEKAGVNTMVEANKAGNKLWKGKEMPGRVARLVRETGDPFAFGEGYHADVTFFKEPPFFTFLLARELPGGSDDTHFIDAVKAYKTLPVDVQKEITGLSCVHNDSAGIWDTHPFVRTHPESGERVLYANSHFTHTVEGYAAHEGKALLEKVFDHVEQQPIYKFKWTCDIDKCGTKCPECMHALMWDNRQLQHTATTKWASDPVLSQRRRELHRVTISGDERPFFRPNAEKGSMSLSSSSNTAAKEEL